MSIPARYKFIVHKCFLYVYSYFMLTESCSNNFTPSPAPTGLLKSDRLLCLGIFRCIHILHYYRLPSGYCTFNIILMSYLPLVPLLYIGLIIPNNNNNYDVSFNDFHTNPYFERVVFIAPHDSVIIPLRTCSRMGGPRN